jgi:hypothetical protein
MPRGKRAEPPSEQEPNEAATEGHNSGKVDLSDEERQAAFHKLRDELGVADAALDKAKEGRRLVVKRAKAAGFLLEEFKVADQLETDEGEQTVKDKIERTLRIARWLAIPIGGQSDMFSQPDRTPAVDRAKAEGKRDGLAGKPRKPDYAPETEQYRSYMAGFDEGQTVLASEGFKKLTPVEQAAAH